MKALSPMTQTEPSLSETAELREVRAPYATQRAVMALILREMSTTYGRSPGGYIWAVLEPVAGIALLTVVFSVGFRSPPLGTSFAIFYATGLLPFMMYGDIGGKLAQTINFSRALLAYPRVTFLDALIARFLLNTMTQFMVHFILFVSLFLIISFHTIMDYKKIVLAYMMFLSLAVGVGVLNSFLFLSYPIWVTVWAVLNRPIFLVSAIFFLFESVPLPYSNWLWWNPLVHPIGMMRDGFYPFYQPTYISMTYVFGLSAVLTIIGLFLLNRYHRDAMLK